MTRERLAKATYVLGLLAFVGSWFAVATPNQASDADGTEIVAWDPPWYTHATIATEPLSRLVHLATMRRDPEARGDGFEAERAQTVDRLASSIPTALGWYLLVGSALTVPWWRRWPVAVRLGGVCLAAASAELAGDFWTAATVWPAHFHLGPGAWLLVAGYLFAGIGLAARPSAGVPPAS